jgi:hypothetical protein
MVNIKVCEWLVQAVSLFLLLKTVILIMGQLSQEGYQAWYAIVEFFADVLTIMPPYWYKLEGDDLGSVACLLVWTFRARSHDAAHDGGCCGQERQRHQNKTKQL